MDSIDEKVKNIMAVVFDVNPDTIDETSSQDNIDGWDSVNHLNLVTSLEEEFNITIPIEAVGEMLNFQLISILIKELIA